MIIQGPWFLPLSCKEKVGGRVALFCHVLHIISMCWTRLFLHLLICRGEQNQRVAVPEQHAHPQAPLRGGLRLLQRSDDPDQGDVGDRSDMVIRAKIWERGLLRLGL